MSSRRLYRLQLVMVFALLAAIIGGAYGINGLLVSSSNKVVAAKARVESLHQQQEWLVKAKKEIATYSDLYQITKSIVPESKDQAEIVRQIVGIANANSIDIAQITFPASTLGGTKAVVTAPGAVSSRPPLSATGSNGKLNLSQLQKVPNITGVYILQTDIISETKRPISYAQLINFLAGIEQNRLTALTTNIEITPDPNIPSLYSFKLTLNSYIKP